MAWWQWLLLGLVLLMFEIATPGGFFILFFGVAAILVGALVALDVGGGSASFQLLLFSVLSVVSLLLFRRRLLELVGRGGAPGKVDSLVGEVATLLEDVVPGGIGKAELRGTAWTVRNDESRNLARGARVRVRQVDGLTLRVGAE